MKKLFLTLLLLLSCSFLSANMIINSYVFKASEDFQFTTTSGTSLDPTITASAGTITWTHPDAGTSTGTTPSPTLDEIGTYTVTTTDYDAVTEFNCFQDTVSAINNLGVFPNLTHLYCHYNSSLTSIDTSTNTALLRINCNNNSLESLSVSANTALTTLYCQSNSLASLSVSANTALALLYCQDNAFSQQEVDDILEDLADNSVSSGILHIAGTNAAPSSAGLTDVTTLEGRGWTVTHTTP